MLFSILAPIPAWAQNSTSDKSESGKQLEIIVGVIIFIMIGIILMDISKNKKRGTLVEITQTKMKEPESVNLTNYNEIEKKYPSDKIHSNTKEPFIHDEKTQWTLEMIKKLQDENIGNSIMLGMIGKSLAGGKHITNIELTYLKEKYLILKKIRKINWTINLIGKLQGYQIGDATRLSAIKNALENDRPVNDAEIDYLKENFAQLTTMLKSSKANIATLKS